MDLTKYKKIFSQESEKYLKELNELLLMVEKEPGDKDLWLDIHGKVHSMKGMARALNLESISELSHSMESWCKLFQSGQRVPSLEEIQKVIEGVDLLHLLSKQLGEKPNIEEEEWYKALLDLFKKGPGRFSGGLQEKSYKPHTPMNAERLDHVRVSYALIEELLGLSQEILLLDRSMPSITSEYISSGLQSWINNYTSMLKRLHFRLTQLRLISISDFSALFTRAIRDLARESKKEVTLEVKGGKLQADVTLLDRLREPFIHIIRNSIAHGIEPPEERIKLGKDKSGKIILKAERERDNLYISISDDGRGIDRSAIVKYLKEKHRLSNGQLHVMPEEELLSIILRPDFSSAKGATHLAGRGIGMNLVSQVIEHLGGKLTIKSKPLQGTELVIRLPVFLSLMQCITFTIADYTVSIPTAMVVSADRRSPEMHGDNENLYDLSGLLGIRERSKAREHILRVISPESGEEHQGEDRIISFQVDNVIGNKQLMVMPAGELLTKTRLIAGVGIMEDGKISVLLDIESIPR